MLCAIFALTTHSLDAHVIIALSALIIILLAALLKARVSVKNANAALNQRNQEVTVQHQAIQQQKETLEELNKVKDKMFSIIAHDFRSPLNTIQGVLSLLHVDALSEQELRMLLPDLTRKVDASINLLDNLLHWSRAQMRGIKTSPQVFPIKKVVDETIAHMLQLAQQKDILIQSFVDPDLLVHADPEMIRLVVRNLLSNAIKFSYESHAIHIEAHQKGEHAVVSITDFGVGINPEVQPELFGYSGYSTRGTAQEKGTGLGLNLCHECVVKNQGDIWLDSEPGTETTFSFTVPLADYEQHTKVLASSVHETRELC